MLPRFWRTIYVIFCLSALLAVPTSSVWAQAGDLPTPARLSVAEGPVSFWRPGDQGWSPAQVNMAIEAEDAIFAGKGATVELQVGARAFMRLMANTQIRIVHHDAGVLQMRLDSGEGSLDARSLPRNQLTEIDTPNAAFAIDGVGYYRIGFRDHVTHFVVRDGHATLELRDGYHREIGDGKQIIVRGRESLTVEVADAPAPDSWDRWNDARSDDYDRAASSRYLPEDVYGAADLDRYGTWGEVSTYGRVWFPTVAPGWAPYTVGTWYWDPIYEWTWVSAEPWGWAPSHYGRWVHISGRWAWAPGPRVMHPEYLPAVVGFVDFGNGPTVGWVALGWGEPIIPWWGRHDRRGRPFWGGWGGPRIVNRRVVEHSADIDINAIRFQNSQVARAVVTVQRDRFGHEHRYHFATAHDGRPMPIKGGLPMRRERAPVKIAPPMLPAERARPVAPAVRKAVPRTQTKVPTLRVEPQLRTAHPPERQEGTHPKVQPRVEPRRAPVERHETRSTRETPQSGGAVQQPHHTIAKPKKSAPVVKSRTAPAPKKAEPSRNQEEQRHRSHGKRDDDSRDSEQQRSR